MTTFTMQDLTTETPEEKEAMDAITNQVIQGATGAQYTFMDTRPKPPDVTQIINNICRELQALSTVITSYQANAETIRKLLDAAALSAKQPTYPTPTEEQINACGK
jgi:hypothetical protein